MPAQLFIWRDQLSVSSAKSRRQVTDDIAVRADREGRATGVAELAIQDEAANNLSENSVVGKALAMPEWEGVHAPHLNVVLAVKTRISLVQVVHGGVIEGYAAATRSSTIIRVVDGVRPSEN